MKKLLLSFLLMAVMAVMSACSDEKMSDDKVYIFYQNGCSHCTKAEQYIKANYPTVAITYLNIALPGNMRMFQQAVRKYNINAQNAGTPLICMGKNYMMGWGLNQKTQFDLHIKEYME